MAGAEERQTLRHVSGLAAQRAADVGAGVLFVSLIPRSMGPEAYGAFSLLQSMSLWFALMSGMGAVSMMVRFVPEFCERGDEAGLRKLMGGMMALRICNGILGGILYFFLARWWIGRVDPVATAALSASIAARTAANLPFTLFLGLNQSARWGLAETLRRLLALPGVWAGFALGGLRGACLGVLLNEIAVLALGLRWARDYLSWPALRIDREFLRPYLRFSAAFVVSNVLLILFQQGGGPLLHLFRGGFAQAGYYTIAFSVYLTVAQAAWRLVNGFGALLSSLRSRGEEAAVVAWVERLLKVFGAGAVLTAAATYSLSGTLVPRILGAEFQPVSAQLALMGIAGLAFGPGAIARVLAVVYHQPRVSIVGAAGQLAVFAGLCAVLVPYDPNWGAAVAAVAAIVVFAVNGIWWMRRFVEFSLRPWTTVMLVGAALSPVIWLWNANGVLRLAVFAALFLGGLVVTRVLSLPELQDLRRRAL